MDYISTRGKDGPISFEDVLLNGLARDGGLYLPVSWPQISKDEMRAMRTMPYHEVAGLIMSRFTEGDIDQAEMTEMAAQTYASFTDKDVAPVTQLDDIFRPYHCFQRLCHAVSVSRL
jgi:threonine synthase